MLLVRVVRRRPRTGTVRPVELDGGLASRGSRLVIPADLAPLLAPVSPPVPATGIPAPADPRSGAAAITIPLLPGEQTLARRARFAAANACTLGSLLLGMSAVFLSMQGGIRPAAACLVGCVVFDGLDGALARRFGVCSPFGAQMDSLADMCSFGIAAPLVVYSSLHGSAPSAAVGAACALVAACAAVRLARFNVSPKDGRFFAGVPTTMTAAVLAIATLIDLHPTGAVAVGAIVLLALAMVSSFPYAKLARIARLPVWVWLIPVIGAFADYRITFAALVGIYLASGPLLWLRRRHVSF